jgi:hypothetical protein
MSQVVRQNSEEDRIEDILEESEEGQRLRSNKLVHQTRVSVPARFCQAVKIMHTQQASY